MEAIFTSGLQQGLLYCFMVLGVYITFRVLDFPDLTVDGSLPLGAAVTAAMIAGGQSPLLATLAGVGAGLAPASSPASCTCCSRSARAAAAATTTAPSCSPAS